MEDGRLRYELKRAWRNGTQAVVFSPAGLVERLMALVPPSYVIVTRYHGVFGPPPPMAPTRHAARESVREAEPEARQQALTERTLAGFRQERNRAGLSTCSLPSPSWSQKGEQRLAGTGTATSGDRTLFRSDVRTLFTAKTRRSRLPFSPNSGFILPNVLSPFSNRLYPNHRVGLSKNLGVLAATILRNLPNPSVRPLETDVSFAFVAGCGHSGTTLLSSRLGNHSKAFLVGRETGAFAPIVGLHGAKLLSEEWSLQAQEASRDVVVEKTPKHIHCSDRIWRLLPSAKVLMLARNPLDCIASLTSRFGDVELAIERWLMDHQPILKLRDHPRCHLVVYEELTRAPAETLRAAIDFISLPWEEGVMTARSGNYGAGAHQGTFALRVEQVGKPIRPNNGGWRARFSISEAEAILKRTKDLTAKLGLWTDELRLEP